MPTSSATEARHGANPFDGQAGAGRIVGDAEGAADLGTFVFFEIGGQCFAIDVASVREILDRQVVTPVPRAMPGIEGVIDLRGRSIAVFDLAGSLGLARGEAGAETRYLVLELGEGGDERRLRAVRTDRVREVAQIAETAIEPPPEGSVASDGPAIRGVMRRDDRMVMVLDLAELFGLMHGAAIGAGGADIFAFDD